MTTRRTFLASTGTALLSLNGSRSGSPFAFPRRADYDLVVRGGTIFDGGGGAGVESDLAVLDGRILRIARRIPGKGREELDARGKAVTPGFIDIHSHVDGSLGEDARAESAIRQGITTVIAGQDGGSRATGAEDKGFDAMFAEIDALKPGVNVASMVGLGSVRGAVVGADDRPATPDELRRMIAMVERAVAGGACGASSGLEYTPGAFASRDELVALCRRAGTSTRPAGRRGCRRGPSRPAP